MTNIIEHFEEKVLSLTLELDGAIMRRMETEGAFDVYKKEHKKKTIEEKLQLLKKLENM